MRTICAVVMLAVMASSGCSRRANTPETTTQRPIAAAPSPEPEPDLLPVEGGVRGYVGSEPCRECHTDEHASWRRSFHRTMTQRPVPGAVQADFSHVILTNDGTRFVLHQTNSQFWVRMEAARAAAPGVPAPEPVDVPMGLVTGSHHMQVFWIGNGLGNCQIGFPFTWLIPEKRWVPRFTTFIRPPDAGHQPETWNFVCARCHTTGPEPGLNRESRTWATRVGEYGISCEACHGPGGDHVTLARQRKREPGRAPEGKAAATVTAPIESATNWAIVHPLKIPAARASQICGFCHSMKWIGAAEPWPERGFRFRPGDDLEQTTPVMRPRQLENQPWLGRHLSNNPALLNDFFWPDGMIRVSGREYNGLIESPCHRGGGFSCLSCHSLHDSDPAGQLARNRTDNRACTQCHTAFQEPARMAAHTHHRAGSSGSECYNCHMPHTTYGVLKAIRSHEISSPAVETEIDTGRPNACNLCHLDKSLAWTATHLAAWFPKATSSGPSSRRLPPEASMANGVRLALSGDAGQRALVAWHMGWTPAVEASQARWMIPILGTLLDDPYAAVRCVAERSLRNSSLPPPAAYDFTTPVTARHPVRHAIFEQWSRDPNSGPADFRRLGLEPGDAASSEAWMEARLQARRDPPLRLRE